MKKRTKHNRATNLIAAMTSVLLIGVVSITALADDPIIFTPSTGSITGSTTISASATTGFSITNASVDNSAAASATVDSDGKANITVKNPSTGVTGFTVTVKYTGASSTQTTTAEYTYKTAETPTFYKDSALNSAFSGDAVSVPSGTKVYIKSGGSKIMYTTSGQNPKGTGLTPIEYKAANPPDITSDTTLKAYAEDDTMLSSEVATLVFNISTTSTAKELDYLRWTEGSKDGFSDITNYNDPNSYPASGSTPAVKLYQTSKTIQHTSGLSIDDIKKELNNRKIDIKLKDVSGNPRTVTVSWDYDFGDNKLSNYSSSKTDKQDFWVYSSPIAYSDNDSSTNKPSYRVGDFEYFRIKMYLTIGDSSSTGTGDVAAPTFNPPSGTYVFPGAKIALSSTTAGAQFRSTQQDTMPSTSSNGGTSGSTIAIPAAAKDGTYKLNSIAYTSTSAYSDVASATYTVVTDSTKYAITEGSGQQASQSIPATFTGNGEASNLKVLYIDDNFVAASYYTVQSGSTIVTVSPTYLQTLSAGTHTIKLVYPDGYASGTFTLTAGDNAAYNINDITNSSGSTGGRAGTGTDDRSNLVIMFVLFGMLIAGLSGAVYFKNEKLRRNRYMD